MLGDFGLEWVQNGPELVGDGPRGLPDTSGTLLGKHIFCSKAQLGNNKTKHETFTRLTTDFVSGKIKITNAYRNSASFDVPDSSPSFNLTPFVTNT